MHDILVVFPPHAEIAVDVVCRFALHFDCRGQRMAHTRFDKALEGEVFRDVRVVGECGRVACNKELHVHGVGAGHDAFTIGHWIEYGIVADLGLHIVLQPADHILK